MERQHPALGRCQKYNPFSSVAQSCLTLCNPMDYSTPGLPVHLLKLMSSELVMPSSHLILCRPLPLPPSIFPSIRVFSNKSVLCIRWPKYWNFSFSVSPSSEYSGLASLRISLLSKGLEETSPTPQLKSINSLAFSFLHSPTLNPYRKTIPLTRWTFVGKVMSAFEYVV